MATEPQTDQAPIAQRPRLVSRLRLVPLTVLVALVVTAAVVGVVHGGQVTAGSPAEAQTPTRQSSQDAAQKAAQKEQRQAERAKSACTPKWRTGVKRQPWRGKARARSEAQFAQRMKKENPAYVKGKSGWLFFTDYQSENFSQAIGRVTQNAQQRKAWGRFLTRSARTVQKAGGEYHVVVAPANWDVYPQKLPTWAQKLRGTTSLDQLMKAYPKLPWIDPRAALRKAGRKHDTYEPLDSHWTPYGGYVAWEAITKCLRATNPATTVEAPPISGVDVVENSNEFASNGVPSGKPRRTVPVFAQPHPATTVTHEPDGEPLSVGPDNVTDTLFTPLKTSTPGAQAPGLTLLTLRDSTGNALSPLWSWSFGTTIQYAHGITQKGFSPPNVAKLMRTYRPEVVLFVITERFLSQKPPRR